MRQALKEKIERQEALILGIRSGEIDGLKALENNYCFYAEDIQKAVPSFGKHNR